MKKTKKIAIFHCGFVYSGGGERVVLEEARRLKEKGFDVLVYAPTLDRKKCYPEIVNDVGVKTFFPSYIDKIPYRNAIRMVLSSLLAPIFAFRFRDIDIFIGANQPGAWIAFCVAKLLKKPYLVYLNQPNRVVYPRPIDVAYGWYSTEKDYHMLYVMFQYLKPVITFLDKLSVVHSNKVFVGGAYMCDIIQNIYSIETHDNPAGAQFQPTEKIPSSNNTFTGVVTLGKSKIKKPYLLITNRHDPQKRFDYVINAFDQVLKKYPNVANLVVTGSPTKHTKELIKLVKKLELDKKVHFVGALTEAELAKAYANTAVYCYPSPEEDFGLGPLEAGGWGVPTVAWNHAGPTVTVVDGVTGFLAKPYEVKDYCEKITKILCDRKLREKMGEASRERTKNEFSWERHVSGIEEVINELLEK